MLTVAVYEMTGILPTDPGYGYYRDHVQMFDPGWKGYQTKGPEDWNFDVFDKGNDPEGVLERYVSCLLWSLMDTGQMSVILAQMCLRHLKNLLASL